MKVILAIKWYDMLFFVACRSSELRMASVNRLTRKLSILDDSDEVVLNFVAKSNWGQSEPQTLTGSLHKELESQLYHLQGMVYSNSRYLYLSSQNMMYLSYIGIEISVQLLSFHL